MSWRNSGLRIINEMEATRTRNNVNWMNVLRLAVRYAPKKNVRILFGRISNEDEEIGKLWKSFQNLLHD